jgi:HSP20 family molecular chaperone IbpA
MALEKWEPMKGIEEFFDRYGRLVAWPTSRHWGALGDWQPRVDIRETDGTYLIQADIPGVEKNDLKVTLEQGGAHPAGRTAPGKPGGSGSHASGGEGVWQLHPQLHPACRCG